MLRLKQLLSCLEASCLLSEWAYSWLCSNGMCVWCCYSCAAAAAAEQELLGTSDTGLRYAVRHNPSILAFSTQTLASRFKGLQQLLECDAAAASKLVRKAPTVASLDLNTIAHKLEELTSGGRLGVCAR